MLHVGDFVGVVKLVDRVLEAEIEQFFFEILQFDAELLGAHASEFFCFHGSNLLCLLFLGNELGLDRQFVTGKTHCLFGDFLGDPVHLEQDASGLHDRDPILGRTFTGFRSCTAEG